MSERARVHKRQRRSGRIALRDLLRDSRAASAIEYGLILSLVVLTMLASLQGVANITISMWNDVSTKVQNAH